MNEDIVLSWYTIMLSKLMITIDSNIDSNFSQNEMRVISLD